MLRMFESESGRAVLEAGPPHYLQHDPFSEHKYKLKGKLGAAGLGSTTFATEGEFDLSGLPAETHALGAG